MWVAAATTSAPSSASSHEETARPPSSGRERLRLRAGRDAATRTSVKSRTRASARPCDWAWTPLPSTARTDASSRASRRVASAEAAAVRVAVMYVPSISATGLPFAGSKTMIAAWWVWRSRFRGKRVTSLQASPADGR